MPELIPLLATLPVLAHICWTDFFHLKIYNRDVLVLLALAVAYLALARPDDVLLRIGLGALLFAVAFVFWLFGKAGAGDAKLLGVTGLLIPPEGALLFAILILVFTLGFHLLCSHAETIRFLPLTAGRRMMELLSARRLPYGVPIAFAAIALVVPRIVPG